MPKELAAMPRKILPPPHDNGDLDPQIMNRLNFFSHILDHVGADAEALITHQGFAAQLQQNFPIARLCQIRTPLSGNAQTV